MNKSKAAFLLTARGLFEKYPKVYFWTVTFYRLHSDWEGSRLFSKFLDHLREVVGRKGWGGVRVVELHKEHGIHYHMLVTERLAVDLVRRVGRCYGIGRIQVDRADVDTADYLAKYMSKSGDRARCQSGRRMRKWAAFGDVPRVRVSDLVNDSPMWVYRREHNLPFLGYRQEALLRRIWDYGEEHFKSAWFALRKGGDEGMAVACGMAVGRLQSHGAGVIAERLRGTVAQPF